MKTKCQYEINRMDGSKNLVGYIETEFDDPVFLNMQFCMERNEYEELTRICKEYKLSGIHEALQNLLTDCDPYKIIDGSM